MKKTYTETKRAFRMHGAREQNRSRCKKNQHELYIRIRLGTSIHGLTLLSFRACMWFCSSFPFIIIIFIACVFFVFYAMCLQRLFVVFHLLSTINFKYYIFLYFVSVLFFVSSSFCSIIISLSVSLDLWVCVFCTSYKILRFYSAICSCGYIYVELVSRLFSSLSLILCSRHHHIFYSN